jgi:transcription-repair coupling factor (superfamily II helicase)
LEPLDLKTLAVFSLDAASFIEKEKGIFIFLCDNYASAKGLYGNLSFFSSKKIFFCEEIIPVSLLYDLRQTGSAAVVTTPGSFFSKVPEPDSLLNSFIHIKKGSNFSRDGLIETLASYGYERTNAIENENEFAVRGEIIDISNSGSPYPVRIDFFDETVEDLRYFDLNTQLSIKSIDAFTVFPVKSNYYPKTLNISESVPNPVLYIEEPETELLGFLNRDPENKNNFNRILNNLNKFYYFNIKKYSIYYGIKSDSGNSIGEKFSEIKSVNIRFAEKLKYENGKLNLTLIRKIIINLIKKEYKVTVVSKNEIHRERLKNIFASIGLSEEEIQNGLFKILNGNVSSGFISKKDKLFLIKGEELFREHLDIVPESSSRLKTSGLDYFKSI